MAMNWRHNGVKMAIKCRKNGGKCKKMAIKWRKNGEKWNKMGIK